jgi:hypothetical protein
MNVATAICCICNDTSHWYVCVCALKVENCRVIKGILFGSLQSLSIECVELKHSRIASRIILYFTCFL